jgi:hypothetical protein
LKALLLSPSFGILETKTDFFSASKKEGLNFEEKKHKVLFRTREFIKD